MTCPCPRVGRVYDVSSDLQTPSQALALGATHSASLGGRAGSSFVRSLGEVAVSFAFGNRPPPPPPPPDVQVRDIYRVEGELPPAVDGGRLRCLSVVGGKAMVCVSEWAMVCDLVLNDGIGV